MVLDEVNDMLKKEFKENISVTRVEGTETNVGINGIQEEMINENIDSKLNEANQNLVKILIFYKLSKIITR